MASLADEMRGFLPPIASKNFVLPGGQPMQRQAAFMQPDWAQQASIETPPYVPQRATQIGYQKPLPQPMASANVPNQDLGLEIIQQLQQNKQQQNERGNLIQAILSARFKPDMEDISKSALRNAYTTTRDSGKYISPEDIAMERVSNELAPYSMAQKAQMGSAVPASVQEYQYFSGLSPQQQAAYLSVKRNPYLNAGGQFINPMTGATVQKTPSPEDMPEFKGQQAQASASGKAAGEAQGAMEKKYIQAPQIEGLLQEAEKLLPNATSGGINTMARDALGQFNVATAGSEIDTQLDVIGAALTGTVPRFEGPQSNYDVALYEKAAGDLANSKKPVTARLAAIKTMRNLNNKYRNGQSVSPMQAPPPSSGWSIERVQ